MKEEYKYQNGTCNSEVLYISVIGTDRLRHIAEPHKDICKCGIKILKKKITDNDKVKYKYSCYECTF